MKKALKAGEKKVSRGLSGPIIKVSAQFEKEFLSCG
jgi:hypothetical protein